ncbi:hypothetical protein CIPAW_05G129500 [Carya illinoinensis]|uniref:Uncharacterized protein n=1 Tax=Carya illinoinensis TaxID=32201 RepID=A0A8T1QJ65_CARIL|nr:hypothetical protein CIPAW_05G129500 [Carya illinoinensis]
MAGNGRKWQIGKQARGSCSGGGWRPEMGGLGRQEVGDEVVKKWWPEVERRRRIGVKSMRPLEAFSGQMAGRLGVVFGGEVHQREGKKMGPVGGREVVGRRWAGGERETTREREGREREHGGADRGERKGGKKKRKEKKRKKKKEKKEKEKEKREEKGKRCREKMRSKPHSGKQN